MSISVKCYCVELRRVLPVGGCFKYTLGGYVVWFSLCRWLGLIYTRSVLNVNVTREADIVTYYQLPFKIQIFLTANMQGDFVVSLFKLKSQHPLPSHICLFMNILMI